ncbi:MAG: hypothetical protein ACKV2V_10735 [Blastocatellia bacterium]
MNSLRPSRLDSGIFLISCAVLLIELLLTRIFSVTMFYHLSFMVVSVAMLGLGIAGLIVNLWPGLFRRERLPSQLALGAMLFAVTSVLAIGTAFRVGVRLEMDTGNWLRIGLIYVVCIIPFLAGGMVVALILTHHAKQANRLYFFDLLGAAVGCLLFIPATNWLGAPTAVILGAAIATASAIVLARNQLDAAAPYLRGAAVTLCLLLSVAVLANLRWNFYDVKYIKGERQLAMLALKWNAFSRVDVQGTPQDLWVPHKPFFAGFSSTLDPEFKIPEAWLRYDADAATQITNFDGDLSRLKHLRYDVSSSPHQMRRNNSVLIIGPGGGRDVLTALSMGASSVTGVEINPITVQLMRKRFRTFTGGLYTGYPGVRIVNDEGRSFVRQSGEKYDLLQASLVDTWAASAAGAYALTENSLYTVEAFEDFLGHLNPDGIIAYSRWYPETLRVVGIGKEAMRRQGFHDPAKHVFVVRTDEAETKLPSLVSLLFKRSPFTGEELTRLRNWAGEMKFRVVYSPDDLDRDVAATEFHQLLSPLGDGLIENYPADISPVFDDRPFFFSQVPLLPWIGNRLGMTNSPIGAGPLNLGTQTLLISVITTAVCTLLLLLLPLVAAKWGRGEAGAPSLGGVSRKRALLWAVYFAGLGLGFIMIEIVLIQRFSLFLGYPVYSLSVVLFTILLASSIGSFLAGRWSEKRALPLILVTLCGVLILYAAILPLIIDAALGLGTTWRLLIAALLTAPLGLLMGMPFPTGLQRAGGEASGLVSWAWAVNGAASVFGSTLAVLISMTWGFSVTFLMGAAAYGIALCVAALTAQPAAQTDALAQYVETEATHAEWITDNALRESR